MKKYKNGNVSMNESELNALIAQAVAQALAQAGANNKPPRKGAGTAQPMVEFTKRNGETKLVTPAQAAAWTKWQNNSKSLDEVKAEFDSKRKAYKPSKELIEAIKLNRAAITLKIAKAQYGFVGTKADLYDLKNEVCKK